MSDEIVPTTPRSELPVKHLFVTGELVVPVIRGNHVDAIIGVCKKPSGYTDQEIELLSQFAMLFSRSCYPSARLFSPVTP